MKKLTIEEMKKINGGGNGLAITTIVVGVITFIVGILSGYSNPVQCKIKEEL